jgi:anti-sigma-K factor RskA
MMDHGILQELVPAYALGAIDKDERRQVEAHLRSCSACRALLADYQAMSDDLLYATPMTTAPLYLRSQLRRQVTPTGRPQGLGAWLAHLRAAPALGLAVLAVLLLAITNVYWIGRVTQAEQQAGVVARLIQTPGITLEISNAVPQGYGVVYLDRAGRTALLCVYDLPSLPAGKTYQVWLIRDGQRESGGLFQVSADGYGALLITAPRPLRDYNGLGVTIEPAGGSPGPTTPRVIGGNL